MQVHKAIERLEVLLRDGDDANFDKKVIRNMIDQLHHVICFEMGDIHDIMRLFAGGKKTITVGDDSIENYKMPYSHTWISFNHGSLYDFGLFVYEEKEETADGVQAAILPFVRCGDTANMIMPHPYIGVISAEQEAMISTSSAYSDKYRQTFADEMNKAKARKNDADDRFTLYTSFAIFKSVAMFNALLGCKNIGTKDNPPPEKLNKARIRRGKLPIFTYKTLVLQPTSKRQKAEEAKGLWDNRVHLCRGHFKEFTEDKPLFGRCVGRYWWQPSVRGRNKDGIVLKDYEMKMPETA